MAVIDLTLNKLKLAGLENYTPPFGTKKPNNVALTTREGLDNFTFPFEIYRPVTISENSSCTGNVEHNSLVEIDTASVTFTLANGAYKGVTVDVMCTASSGSASVLCGAIAYLIPAGGKIKLVWDGSIWQNERQLDDALTAINVTVAVADFVVDSTYTDYGYKAEISMPGVNSNYSPDVRFSLTDAASGIFAPVADTDTDKVIIYASEVPAADITIPVIICTPLSA